MKSCYREFMTLLAKCTFQKPNKILRQRMFLEKKSTKQLFNIDNPIRDGEETIEMWL